MSYQLDYQKAWHDMAVGMYYRAQAEANPAVYYHWEQQSLSEKLRWQAKAKMALSALCAVPLVFVTVEGGVAQVDVEGCVSVRLRDYDTDGQDDGLVKDTDGSLCVETFFGVDGAIEKGEPATEDWSCDNCGETAQDGSGTCITCGSDSDEDGGLAQLAEDEKSEANGLAAMEGRIEDMQP